MGQKKTDHHITKRDKQGRKTCQKKKQTLASKHLAHYVRVGTVDTIGGEVLVLAWHHSAGEKASEPEKHVKAVGCVANDSVVARDVLLAFVLEWVFSFSF